MISAIVLAAGLSTRMGEQKLFLPWGNSTVIGKVISTLEEAGIEKPHVVTGENHNRLAELLKGSAITLVYNQDYANEEMLTSVQVGLRSLAKEIEAILVVLGDQPQVEIPIVRKLVKHFHNTQHHIIVPSYQMHRGHPWLLGRACWDEILSLKPPETLRTFLNRHDAAIDYLVVKSSSVLLDLDTQADYSRDKP